MEQQHDIAKVNQQPRNKRPKRQGVERKKLEDIKFYSEDTEEDGEVLEANSPDLCNTCTSPEFLALLRGTYQDGLVLPITKANWRSLECPFCKLVRNVLMRDYGQEVVEEALKLEGFTCKLFPRAFCRSGMYLRRDSISQLQRLRVRMGTHASFDEWGRDVVPNDRSGRFLDSGLLDIVLPRVFIHRAQERQAMIRVPVGRRCEISTIQDWLSICDGTHRHGKQSHREEEELRKLAASHRFRLIDVTTGVISVVTHRARYVALSYVWGKSMSHYASAYDKARGDGPFDLDSMPATVRDAIRVVKALGERYLWVDAFCIMQSDAQDKEIVINAMSAVYSGAHLTIVGADGDDAQAGLSRLHDNPSAEEFIMKTFSYGFLPAVPTPDRVLADTAWQTRAWTYQENALSARCLYFTRNEVFLRCSEEDFRECYTLVAIPGTESSTRCGRQASGKRVDQRFRLGQRKLLGIKQYAQFVYDYSSRQLTLTGDRLDAFKAILHRFRDDTVSDSQEMAESGIPVNFMYRALCWGATYGSKYDREKSFRILADARGSRSFPSWTWVAWTEHVTVPDWRDGHRMHPDHLQFKVLDDRNIIAEPNSRDSLWEPWPIQPSLCNTSPKGCVSIHLWAPVVRVRLRDFRDPHSYYNFELIYANNEKCDDADSKLVGLASINSELIPDRETDTDFEAILYHKTATFDIILTRRFGNASVRISQIARGYSGGYWSLKDPSLTPCQELYKMAYIMLQ